MNRHTRRLLDRARGPLGPRIQPDFGVTSGPLAELAELLAAQNGCYVFNAGVQIFHAGPEGFGPDLAAWNAPGTWKYTYGGLADDLFCFGQDLFGTQFAVVDNRKVVAFDPETAQRSELGTTLDAWARWLLRDPDVNGTYGIATAWQDAHGALDHTQRLVPWQFFVLGGQYDLANMVAKPAVECMRIRGPIARQVHDLPDGAQVQLIAGDGSGMHQRG